MDKDGYETYEYLQAGTADGLTEGSQFFVVQDDGTFLNQFSLVAGENLYANSFLLQAGPSTEEKMDEDVVVDGMCEMNQQQDIEDASNVTSPYTEITLTETQYHTLEQKGWILLETLEKIFLLDTVGLHDITNNKEFIQNLKHEIQLDSIQENSNRLLEDDGDNLDNLKIKSEIISQSESVIIKPETLTLIKKDDGVIELKPPSESDCDVNVEDIEQNTNSVVKPEVDTLRIKTNLSLKDIPDEIVLGRTINGKKLVARVKLRHTLPNITSEETPEVMLDVNSQNTSDFAEITPTDAQFKEIVDKAQKSQYPFRPKAISDSLINLIVSQLIKMPTFKLQDYNLVISKVNNDDSGSEIDSKLAPHIIAGSIKANGKYWQFHHHPHILFQYDASSKDDSKAEILPNKNPQYNILHVHVMEMKKVDNIEKISMTVNKRYLPIATPKVEIALACTECARVFKKKEEFDEHFVNHKLEPEDSDFKEAMKEHIKLENGPSKKVFYCCVKCDASFDTLSTCQRHMKIHAVRKNSSEYKDSIQDSDQSTERKKLYQCKMCTNSYVFSASLSKHIKQTHIKVQETVK